MKQVQDVDIKLLRVFVTIVKCGGFSAAQSVLNISQSTISEYMNRLETRIGVTLCQRGRSGFQLTEPGERIFQSATKLLNQVEQFRLDTADLTGTLQGELRIGLIDNTITNAEFRFVDAIRNFNHIAENVRIDIQVLPPNELEQRILNSELHTAISPFPIKIPGIDYQEIFTELHQLYCGIGHPLFDGEFCQQALAQSRVIAHGYEHKVDLKLLETQETAAVVNNMEAEALLIMTGRYVGYLPEHYAQHWVNRGELKPIQQQKYRYDSPFYLITKAGAFQSDVMLAFLNHFKASMKK